MAGLNLNFAARLKFVFRKAATVFCAKLNPFSLS